ncbi:MarR family winged helix-turn-helix transcriptional regulator [Leucobacter sp. OH1287]|uniref:MarR family winged helix-turn-helix transcriptional regulator n=1 Tax=Leucobacter sp. OH1287 TaxID=2491049 RepID=UPI000F5E6B08|nr:MarR family transcriptional regulator [Leucobacter sp. OH1287]RRD60511.1 MarR family transcriptional regulator [Leucobacter sp. OH1287]
MSKHDETERILEQWAEQRPDLDLDPLAIFSRVGRITKQLNRARQQAFESSGLELWEFDVLAVLRRLGSPYRASTSFLVRETKVSSGTMTNRIDRMCGRGLVQRVTDPNDGRGVLVVMTADGLNRVDTALTHLSTAETLLLKGVTASERARLITLLRKLAVSVEVHGDEAVAVNNAE